MSDPIRLGEALLDEELLAKLPGLLPHLANPRPPALPPHTAQLLEELHSRAVAAADSTTDLPTTEHSEENPMDRNGIDGQPVSNSNPDDHDQRERERDRRIEAETEQTRERARLEETRRTQEALRASGYDGAIIERTRPSTPRPPR